MACLLKPPQGSKKGCVTITTPERDFVMRKDANTLTAIESLKDRYFIGLHHNWHDFDFVYDPLFDFSMAGDEDLIERGGRSFPRTEIDCCYFVPAPFFIPRTAEPFWDVINVTREAYFKGQMEFLESIRAIYDQGRMLRILHLCPVQRAKRGEDPVPAIRRQYEDMFSVEERRLFTLLTMDWDHPRPLDLETVAFFYRSSRVFVHTAPDERRCRIAAYSWANQMPVLGRSNVGSLLPKEMQVEPFFFEYQDGSQLPARILDALDCDSRMADWNPIKDLFRPENTAARLSQFLEKLAAQRRETVSSIPINPSHLDFRMGRHHLPAEGISPNILPQTLIEFCDILRTRSDEDLTAVSKLEYPEEALLPLALPSALQQSVMESQLAKATAPLPKSLTPTLKQRLRTTLRRGFVVPLTGCRLVIDILRVGR
jgi:hypothetical protein